MSKPMTTEEAFEMYTTDPCPRCAERDVEDRTGSTRCPSCDGRVWFADQYPCKHDYECPYCHSKQVTR